MIGVTTLRTNQFLLFQTATTGAFRPAVVMQRNIVNSCCSIFRHHYVSDHHHHNNNVRCILLLQSQNQSIDLSSLNNNNDISQKRQYYYHSQKRHHDTSFQRIIQNNCMIHNSLIPNDQTSALLLSPSSLSTTLIGKRNNHNGCSSINSAGNSTNNDTKDEERHILLEYITKNANNDGEDVNNNDVVNTHDELKKNKNDQHHDVTIAILTLNRPKANAMGTIMLQQLKESLKQLEDDCNWIQNNNNNEINIVNSNNNNNKEKNLQQSSSLTSMTKNNRPRCLIIKSYSTKVFSAGADLKERLKMSIDETDIFVHDLRMTFHRISTLTIPVIACIEGIALGGGFEIALAADIRIAASNTNDNNNGTSMGLPETSLGIIPGAGGTQRLSRLIGVANAKELIWTNRRLNGIEAKELGIVQHVVPAGEVYQTALDIAWKIASNTSPIAIQASKYSIDYGIQESNMNKALDLERTAYYQTIKTKDRNEGLLAFQEKRKPIYRGE